MITTNTPFIAADGLVLTYHALADRFVDLATGVVTLTVGSWPHEAYAQDKPHQTTDLIVRYSTWLPEYYHLADDTVMAHPDWIGSGPTKPSSAHIWSPLDLVWLAPVTKPQTELDADQWVLVRGQRNALLTGSDWTQMPDAPDTAKAAWATYRQALRDITVQADPFNLVWPVSP